jgi:hypothetical protein
MSLNLVRRSTKGQRLTAADHDGNLDKLEGAIEEIELTPGPEGPPGPAGVASAWLNGTGAPDAELGAEGDYYLDVETGDIYGPKGETWGEVVFSILEGQQGPAGANGQDGSPGAAGADGAEIELQATATHLQWRYVGAASWTNLVALSEITGPPGADGANGQDGPPGADGREVELQTTATHVQWRYVGGSSWTDLIALSELEGPAGADGLDGDDGAPGPAIELQTSATHIQWRVVGATSWIDLVTLSSLTGPAGPAGSDATATPLSDATPQAPGTAAPGTSSSAARGDHVHAPPGLVTSTTAGLIPAPPEGEPSGKVFTDALEWAEAPGGGATPAGSAGEIQIHDGEDPAGLGAVTGFKWDAAADTLDVPGDINLDDGGTYTTTLQMVTATANRTISFPDATGTVALVGGSSGQLTYNLNGAQAGTSITFDATTGTRHVLPFGYGSGAGGTVTQATSKATGVTLNTRCGQITLNAAELAADTAVSFTLTNSQIAATDIVILNHVSAGTYGAYLTQARAAAGSASISVRNLTAGALSEAIVIGFAVIKATTE